MTNYNKVQRYDSLDNSHYYAGSDLNTSVVSGSKVIYWSV